jgi:hypothetical protein
MMIRRSRLALAVTLVVLLPACSAQSAETRRPEPADRAAASPAAPPATAATSPAAAEVSPAAGPAVTAAAAAVPASATPASADGGPAVPPVEPAAEYREITIPAGTALPIDLRTTVASDTSHVEDRVSAALRRAVIVRGVEVLPPGTRLVGHVTEAERSARVKGRGRVAFRFTSLDAPGDGGRTAIRTSTVVREAPATKKQDAAKIGGGAVGGAAIGAILGGGGGAAKGAAIGGAAGTGVVLSTRGKEVRVPAGTNLIVKLQAPITVRVRR